MPSPYAKIEVDGKTVNLHRHLMEKHLGRKLGSDVVVHHKNHHKRDNRLENLEVVTHAEHAQEHVRKYPDTKPCVVCGTVFTPRPTKRKSALTCSRACHRKRQAESHAKLSTEQRGDIKRRFAAGGVSKAQLARDFNVNKTTIGNVLNDVTRLSS
jgi:hypothetical protein